jgi:hypothetical protein
MEKLLEKFEAIGFKSGIISIRLSTLDEQAYTTALGRKQQNKALGITKANELESMLASAAEDIELDNETTTVMFFLEYKTKLMYSNDQLALAKPDKKNATKGKEDSVQKKENYYLKDVSIEEWYNNGKNGKIGKIVPPLGDFDYSTQTKCYTTEQLNAFRDDNSDNRYIVQTRRDKILWLKTVDDQGKVVLEKAINKESQLKFKECFEFPNTEMILPTKNINYNASLTGLTVHKSTDATVGHYTTIKIEGDKKYEFDDHTVTKLLQKAVLLQGTQILIA